MFPNLRSPTIAIITAILTWPQIAATEDRLPALIIRVPESVTTLFVAETSTAQFHRFDRKGDKLALMGSYYMSIGRGGPGKQRSRDKRTPLGAYFITEQLDTSELHTKYGISAFPLDYPNAWDLRAARDGDGIWVHGVDPATGRRPKLDTDGCIALTNEDLSVLAPEFRDNVTPVLITRAVNWVDASHNRALRIELEDRVNDWANSGKHGDLHAYLSFYDDDFERWGMNLTEWSSLILQTDSLRPIQEAAVSDLLLTGYPEEEGVYLSRFQQKLLEADRQTVITKRLYWRRDTNGVLKIIAEDDG
jgi:murein L,D-transpeptidase YafK